MFKKFMSLTLALVMALGLFAGAVDYKDASDIADYAKNAVQTVYDLNLMQGDNNGNFKPNDPVTREQMMRVMYSLYEAGLMTAPAVFKTYLTNSKIADKASVATWADAYAGYAIVNGIFAGDKADGTGDLNPKGNITYQQMSVILLIALGYDRTYIQTHTGIPGWGENAITLALRSGLLNDLPGNTVYAASASRQDVAVMLANALKASTVTFNTTKNAYEKGVSLIKANFDLDKAADALVGGVVVAFDKDNKTYTVATALNETKNDFGATETYKLASGEVLNPALVGEKVVWSVRGDDSRINNMAVAASDKRIDNVAIGDISVSGSDKITIKIGSTELLKDIASADILLYSAGNGMNAINDSSADIFAALASGKVAEPYKVSIAYNKIGDKHVIGLIGLYDMDQYGFGQITEIKDGLVTVDGEKYIAASTSGLAKNDYVYYSLNAFVTDKDDHIGASFTKVAPVVVKGDKFATKKVGSTTTYSIDSKTVVNADASLLTAAGALFFGSATVGKDTEYNVYAIDGYVFNIIPKDDDIVALTYDYGMYLDSYFTNNTAYVQVLVAGGDKVTLPVAKIGGKDAEQKNFTPRGYEDGAFVFPWAIGEDVSVASIITFVKNGDKYNIVVNEIGDDGKSDPAFLVNKDVTPKSAGESDELTVGNTAAARKFADVFYTKDTVFFVAYTVNSKPKVVSLTLSDLKATQASITNATYLTKTVGGVEVITHAFIDLTKVESLTLFTPVASDDTTIVLTEVPVVTIAGGKTTVELVGIVGGKLVTGAYEVKDVDVEDFDVAVLTKATFELTDGKLTAFDVDEGEQLEFAVLDIFSLELGLVKVKDGDAYDITASTVIFYFDKDGKLVDKYDVKVGTDDAFIENTDANATVIYVLKGDNK